MKKLIELLYDNGNISFNTKNIVRLVKCLEDDLQTRAIEILLGQEDYYPGVDNKYYEIKEYKHWFQSYNLLTDRVNHKYKEKKSKAED